MPKFHLFAASCALALVLNSGAYAASVSEQIAAAIAADDFIAVEAIVVANPAANPAANDQATEALLRYVRDNIKAKPMKAVLAAEAMDVALQLGPRVVPAGAKPVADLVKEISEQASVGCASLTSKTTSDAGKANGKAIGAVQNGAEALAQLPVLVAANPQLVSDVKGENAKCRGGEDVQLFQASSPPPLLRSLPPGQPPAGDLPSGE